MAYASISGGTIMSILFMQVFADHDSSLDPIDVPRDWIWNLPRRTVYFGTSIPTIFKGNDYNGFKKEYWSTNFTQNILLVY
jgi:hypothetical protein